MVLAPAKNAKKKAEKKAAADKPVNTKAAPVDTAEAADAEEA